MFLGELVNRTKLLSEGFGREKKKKTSQGHLDVQGFILFSKKINEKIKIKIKLSSVVVL